MTTNSMVTAKNFGTKLSSVVKRSKTAREDLQALLVFGLVHYRDHADTCYLNKSVQACVGVGSLDTRKMQQYLQFHANIAWTKVEIKSGAKKGQVDYVFKKKGEHAEVTLPSEPWYEFEKEVEDKPAIDVLVKLVNFRKTIAKEYENDHVTDKDMAIRVLEGLDFEIAALTTPANTKLVAVG